MLPPDADGQIDHVCNTVANVEELKCISSFTAKLQESKLAPKKVYRQWNK